MISNRSTWLALAAVLTVLNTSCMLFSQRSENRHALAVKAQSDADLAMERTHSAPMASDEPEYFEGSAAPDMPLLLQEKRPAAPSSSHVWIAGHHTRRAGEWAWVAGRYAMPPRSDMVWVPGHWVSHLHGYVWIGGAWR